MASRNLTEVFVVMRNNSFKNHSLYLDKKYDDDAERLLKNSMKDIEEGLEMREGSGGPPAWIDKLEEAQYNMSKIKPKLDELGSLHARHLLRPAFDEDSAEELEMEQLNREISKLLTSTHRHTQYIRSNLGIGSKMEQRLIANVVTYLLLELQELTTKFRNNQNGYINQLNSREERSQKYFEIAEFDNNGIRSNNERENYVDSFDNFFQPDPSVRSSRNNTFLYDSELDQQIDEHFQRPISNRVTQQQILLFEEDNARLAAHREEEITKIVKSIYDLNDIFKDLGQMVQEQGTVLDRIDYNVEQTQTKVYEGLRQLHRAEMYQRKNRKMCLIIILAAVTLFLLLLLIFTKF